jgi:hypothetical protein
LAHAAFANLGGNFVDAEAGAGGEGQAGADYRRGNAGQGSTSACASALGPAEPVPRYAAGLAGSAEIGRSIYLFVRPLGMYARGW